MQQLETELRKCRREVYVYKKQHDAAWLTKVEAHRRKEKAQALRPRVSGLGRAQVAAAAAADAAWPHERVEASVFARVLQDIEDRCLGCVRRVLAGRGLAGALMAARRAIGGGG